jgi:peptidoglycan/LPS O-acetylase OafA/YrhL
LRCFACIWIVFTHLWWGGFEHSGLILETNKYISFIIYGITGKFAVAMFSVLLGYFAVSTGAKGNKTFGEHCINRYSQFSVNLLAVNILAVIIMLAMGSPIVWNNLFQTLVKDSFLYETSIVPTYWCMKDFFFASILCFAQGVLINKKYKNTEQALLFTGLFITVLYLIGKVWIANCFMGVALYLLQNSKKLKFLKNPVFLVASVPLIIYFYRRPESVQTYFYNGMASALIVFICFNSKFLIKILSFKYTAKLGAISFYLYLIHPLVQKVITPFAMSLKERLDINLAFFVSFFIEMVIVILASAGLDVLNRKYFSLLPKWFLKERAKT